MLKHALQARVREKANRLWQLSILLYVCVSIFENREPISSSGQAVTVSLGLILAAGLALELCGLVLAFGILKVGKAADALEVSAHAGA